MNPTPGPGRGIYVADFVAMHVAGANLSEHGDSHFLPWHRLYLLDLERLLQAIKPTVTLPYWRFDQPAPNLFTEDFMGAMDQIPRDTTVPGGEPDPGFNTPLARFAVGNPLSRWQIGDVQGIPRTARFNPQTGPANGMIFVHPGRPCRFRRSWRKGNTEAGRRHPEIRKTPSWGTSHNLRVSPEWKVTPHGAAHVSFNGPINSVPVAPRDPLFFLLHCNVDRLWALWQHLFERDDRSDRRTYPYQQAGDADPWEIISARQWPWDGGRSQPDNLLPPGTRKENFTKSDLAVAFPSNSPTLAHAIDPFANRDQDHYLGFGYDDVPYDHAGQDIA